VSLQHLFALFCEELDAKKHSISIVEPEHCSADIQRFLLKVVRVQLSFSPDVRCSPVGELEVVLHVRPGVLNPHEVTVPLVLLGGAREHAVFFSVRLAVGFTESPSQISLFSSHALNSLFDDLLNRVEHVLLSKGTLIELLLNVFEVVCHCFQQGIKSRVLFNGFELFARPTQIRVLGLKELFFSPDLLRLLL